MLSALTSRSQEDKITDKLLDEICESIRSNTSKSDSARLSQAFEKHLLPLFRTMDSTQAMEAWDRVFFRLQVKCPAFRQIMDKYGERKGDWKTVDEKPLASTDAAMCKTINTYQQLSYLEPSGDTVHVTLSDGTWTERFTDGTYSKLKFYWVNNCEFYLEFIESNNHTRKNLSRPGDKYSYQVLDRSEGYYFMSAQFVGRERYSTFKIYY
jgi:hypothetical protein